MIQSGQTSGLQTDIIADALMLAALGRLAWPKQQGNGSPRFRRALQNPIWTIGMAAAESLVSMGRAADILEDLESLISLFEPGRQLGAVRASAGCIRHSIKRRRFLLGLLQALILPLRASVIDVLGQTAGLQWRARPILDHSDRFIARRSPSCWGALALEAAQKSVRPWGQRADSNQILRDG